MPRAISRGMTKLAVVFVLFTLAPADGWAQQAFSRDRRPMIRRPIPVAARGRSVSFARTELYFGTAKPEGVVTETEFLAFLDTEVTPRFPDGLTLLKGDGQFTGENGMLIKEESYVLILLYPTDSARESSRKIQQIRERYTTMFEQESVLRADDPFAVWVSF